LTGRRHPEVRQREARLFPEGGLNFPRRDLVILLGVLSQIICVLAGAADLFRTPDDQ
jgi:hypothetical protein